jgi:hypothetical protein
MQQQPTFYWSPYPVQYPMMMQTPGSPVVATFMPSPIDQGPYGSQSSDFSTGTPKSSNDEMTESVFEVPKWSVGPLLGKRGAHLDFIRTYTGCKVYVISLNSYP